MQPLEQEATRFIAAWMRLRQVIQAANFNRFQQAGLSATQFMTLNVVPQEGMTLSELARSLNLSPATLSETVKSLEERGLVRRTRQEGDARKVNICATDEGEAMQNSASQEFHGFLSGLFGRMGKRRREGLLTGLEEMVKLSMSSREPAETNPRADGVVPGTRSMRRSPRR
jgi:DNA-binding MarR family transcriptional regulator